MFVYKLILNFMVNSPFREKTLLQPSMWTVWSTDLTASWPSNQFWHLTVSLIISSLFWPPFCECLVLSLTASLWTTGTLLWPPLWVFGKAWSRDSKISRSRNEIGKIPISISRDFSAQSREILVMKMTKQKVKTHLILHWIKVLKMNNLMMISSEYWYYCKMYWWSLDLP